MYFPLRPAIISYVFGKRTTPRNQRPVSRKSRNFTGHFRVSQFPLYLKNGEDLSHQTSQSFFFLLPLKHVKRLTFQNERLAVSQMAFRARKVFGTIEKQAPGHVRVAGKNMTSGHPTRHLRSPCLKSLITRDDGVSPCRHFGRWYVFIGVTNCNVLFKLSCITCPYNQSLRDVAKILQFYWLKV